MNDAELLQRYIEGPGGQEAFAELVQSRIDLVYTAALRQVGGDVHRAKDVAQIVFLDLARNASLLRGHPSLAGWLFTATRFAASNIIRSERARQLREHEALTLQESMFAPGATPDWDRLRPVIDEAMHELEDQDRQVILMRFFERAQFATIGSELGVTENAARKMVERALDRLGGFLNRRGITSTSSALAAAIADQAVLAAPSGFAATVAGAATSGAGLGATFSTLSSLILMITGKSAGVTALLALLGLALYEYSQLRSADVAILAAGSETSKLQADIERSAERGRELEARLASATAEAADRAEAVAAIRIRLGAPIIAPDALPDAKPPLAGLELQNLRIFSPVYSRLNLPPEKAAYLTRLIAGGGNPGYGAETANSTMLGALWREGIDADSDPGLIALMRDAQWRDRGVTQAITALVGEEAYKVIRQYREDDPASSAGVALHAVATVVNRTPPGVAPTQQQEDQLRQLLVELAPPNWGMASDAVTYDMTALSQAMLDRAAAFLTPTQLAPLQMYKLRQETDLAKRRIQLEKRRAGMAQLIDSKK